MLSLVFGLDGMLRVWARQCAGAVWAAAVILYASAGLAIRENRRYAVLNLLFPVRIANNVDIRPAAFPAKPADHIRRVFRVVVFQEIACIRKLDVFFSRFHVSTTRTGSALHKIVSGHCQAIIARLMSRGLSLIPMEAL